MSRTLIACYCEPNKPALNWQLHALYLSYRDLDSDRLDFRVSLPAGTESMIDRRIPFRVVEPISPRLQHPVLRQHGFDSYSYANHFLAVSDSDASYDHILLTDVDTLLLPRLTEQEPQTFVVGRGGYSTDYNHERLIQFARNHGYTQTGRYRNVGPTWYGEANLVIQCARETIEVIQKLLYEEDWTGTEWPRWWIGVIALYASEIVLSERIDRLTLVEGGMDAPVANGADDRAIHLHMWHTHDWRREFSKHAYDDGKYDLHDEMLTGRAAYALKMARRGSAMRDLAAWKRHVENSRSPRFVALRNVARAAKSWWKGDHA